VKAYKFLLDDRIAPFSRFHWPVGEWVVSADHVACSAAIHACERADLPFWLMDELWEIELSGATARGRHKLVATSGRLVRRVDAWDRDSAAAFGEACVARVRDLAARRPEAAGHLADLEAWTPHVRPVAAGSLAARAFEAVEGRDGYNAERAAQTAWLVDRLALPS
jgi:hypothetical protein